jgi:hypothetical protein
VSEAAPETRPNPAPPAAASPQPETAIAVPPVADTGAQARAVAVPETAAAAAKAPPAASAPVSMPSPPAMQRNAPTGLRPLDPGSETGSRWDQESQGVIEDERPRTAYLTLASYAPQGGACRQRISHKYGDAFGIVSDALLVPGNQSCVQATYGDLMTLTVETCGGRLTEIQQIEVERGAFRDDGRSWTAPASLSYTLIANGRETPPMPLGTGGYSRVQRATFAPMAASAVKIILRSPRTRGYAIYQRLCSITLR